MASDRPIRILVAPNAFKESLTAMEAAQAISRGVLKVHPKAKIFRIPIADGGDGTLEAVVAGTSGSVRKARVLDPLGRKITAEYGLTGDGKTAIIEMSRASGLALVPPGRRNPMKTTSFGTGQLIRAALDAGVRNIILGIGGSATVDGGIGALQALGIRLLNGNGKPVAAGGEGLVALRGIDCRSMHSALRKAKLLVACDVDNPLIGPKGAAAVFGPQKGATAPMVRQLDKALARFGKLIERTFGRDVSRIPGTGAAGGIAGSFKGILGAELRPGSELIFDLLKVNQILPKVDLVITGEGRIDFQTPFGKGPGMLAKLASRHGLPVIGIAGSVADQIENLYQEGFSAIFSIVKGPMELRDAMQEAASLMEFTAEQVTRMLCHVALPRFHHQGKAQPRP
ncbi:MAG: glycerate kinase [Acidobacteriota bacterium]